MAIVAFALTWALQILLWLLIARFFADLLISLNPQYRPKKLVLVLFEIVFTITDVPLKLVRKVVKPIRIGGAGLDFSWTVAFLIITILQGLIARLG
jgi:YggT family protein